jgi:hypothetical protein
VGVELKRQLAEGHINDLDDSPLAWNDDRGFDVPSRKFPSIADGERIHASFGGKIWSQIWWVPPRVLLLGYPNHRVVALFPQDRHAGTVHTVPMLAYTTCPESHEQRKAIAGSGPLPNGSSDEAIGSCGSSKFQSAI